MSTDLAASEQLFFAQEASIQPIDQLTERLGAAVALLRATGYEPGDIADALLSEGAALSTVTHGGPATIRRLNGMGRLIQRRAHG